MIIEDEKFKELTTAYTRALEKLGTVAGLIGFEADAELTVIVEQVLARIKAMRTPKPITPAAISPAEQAAIDATLSTAKAHAADGASV